MKNNLIVFVLCRLQLTAQTQKAGVNVPSWSPYSKSIAFVGDADLQILQQ